MVLKHRRPLPTPKEAMHDLLEEGTTTSLTKELGDASTGAPLLSQRGGYRGCGGRSGTGDSHESKCTYCKIDSYTTDACRKCKRAQDGGNNDEHLCFQCGLPGHVKVDCVSYKRIKEWWRVKKATATAALVSTGDCNCQWRSACALTAATLNWVIDSGASHPMCNDRSRFSPFKKLSLPIIIKLGNKNSVTTTYYVFVDVIQSYQVKALHTPTFRLSLLWIKQLNCGGHTSIFRHRKCSITSPFSCTLTGKISNGIYIVFPATALLSSTSKNGRNRMRDSSLPRVLTTEPTIEPTIKTTIKPTMKPTIKSTIKPTIKPTIKSTIKPTLKPTFKHTIEPTIEPTIESTIESSRPPITAKTKSTRDSLTIPESNLWHRPLAYINLTAMTSLIDGYTHDDSQCAVCIQAKHKQRFIGVPVKHTTKPVKLVHSDACGPFSTPTCGDNRCYILFIYDYTRYTSIWLLPNKTAKTCTSAYQSFLARMVSIEYEIKRFRCDNGWGEYDDDTFRFVLAARGTTYEPCPPYPHYKIGVAKRMISTLTENVRAMRIDSQARIQLWRKEVNTAVYLDQRSPDEGLNRKKHREGFQAPYEAPYALLHGFGKPTHNANGNKISYHAPLHNLGWFRCYASRLIPEVQCQDKFCPRSKPCMMVGYIHNSETLWRIWDSEFQMVKAQSEVIFHEERNTHMSCQHGSNEIDIFELPEDEEYVKETDTGDEPLRGQDSQPTHIRKGSTSHMHEAPDAKAEYIAHSQHLRRENQTAQRLAADAENIAHSQRICREDQTAQCSAVDAENIAHHRRLRQENQTARRSAAANEKSSQVPPASPAPPMASWVTRSQGKASAEALTASEDTGDPFTYTEAMESPQPDHWKRAMEEESTLILLNNTFSTLNSPEAWQLQVKPIGSK